MLIQIMVDENVSCMTDARREYVASLAHAVYPHIYGVIDEMYAASPTLISFQTKLQEVPNWNQGKVDLYTNRICNHFTYFTPMLSAVFVSWVRVMTFKHLGIPNSTIRVKIPTNAKFVHGLYTAVAHRLYDDPHSYRRITSDAKMSLLEISVTATVRALMPKKEVLQLYLGDSITPDGEITPSALAPDQSEDEQHHTPAAPQVSDTPEVQGNREEDDVVDFDLIRSGVDRAPAVMQPDQADQPDQPDHPPRPFVGGDEPLHRPVREAAVGDEPRPEEIDANLPLRFFDENK